jgi:alkylhydroperoxidase/carboxymuconolactone decarboxylase family protein YurZ
VWFKKSHVGINYFSAMWKLMKEQAGLEGHITNHLTHWTAITNLYAAGVPKGKIRQKSGHCLSHSVQAYNELTAPKKRKLVDILQGEECEAVHVQEALLAQVPKALHIEVHEALHVQEVLMAQVPQAASSQLLLAIRCMLAIYNKLNY